MASSRSVAFCFALARGRSSVRGVRFFVIMATKQPTAAMVSVISGKCRLAAVGSGSSRVMGLWLEILEMKFARTAILKQNVRLVTARMEAQKERTAFGEARQSQELPRDASDHHHEGREDWRSSTCSTRSPSGDEWCDIHRPENQKLGKIQAAHKLRRQQGHGDFGGRVLGKCGRGGVSGHGGGSKTNIEERSFQERGSNGFHFGSSGVFAVSPA